MIAAVAAAATRACQNPLPILQPDTEDLSQFPGHAHGARIHSSNLMGSFQQALARGNKSPGCGGHPIAAAGYLRGLSLGM